MLQAAVVWVSWIGGLMLMSMDRYVLGGIFEDSHIGTDSKVLEDLNETIRNREEKI